MSTELRRFKSKNGTTNFVYVEGHEVQVYVTEKRKQIRIFVDGHEWKRTTPTSRDDGADECRGDGAGEFEADVADNTDFNHQSQIERHEA